MPDGDEGIVLFAVNLLLFGRIMLRENVANC